MKSLDIYAESEKLFDLEDAMNYLWGEFIEHLKKLNIKTILDIGCGNGKFCKLAKESGFEIVGIDVSEKMVEIANQNGCDAKHIDLNDYKGEKFECAVAIFDVINYMDRDYLKNFFTSLNRILKDDGYFLFDINSYFGFDEIAQGTVSANSDESYAILNSVFEDNKLFTKVTFFHKDDNDLYSKNEGEIIQYYYSKDDIKEFSKEFFDLVAIDGLKLYSDEVDKYLITLRKRDFIE